MTSARLETFTDGVIAILITIMVLELSIPEEPTWDSLRGEWPTFLAYALSFINLGIYWNNHHHMLHTVDRINGKILWANLHLLFWLSLFPFTTAWMGEEHFAETPTAAYGVASLLAAISYYVLQKAIISEQGPDSKLAAAVGNDIKGKISPILYLAGIVVAPVFRYVALGLYVVVALMWLIPDRRIESRLEA